MVEEQKKQIIRSLKARGINVFDIATVVQLTPLEVEQVLKDEYAKVRENIKDIKIESADAFSEMQKDLSSLVSKQLEGKAKVENSREIIEATKLRAELQEKRLKTVETEEESKLKDIISNLLTEIVNIENNLFSADISLERRLINAMKTFGYTDDSIRTISDEEREVLAKVFRTTINEVNFVLHCLQYHGMDVVFTYANNKEDLRKWFEKTETTKDIKNKKKGEK